jgi:hypothetical protein
MSKKKNTLQDLDDFLKQQAATLVTPESLIKIEARPEKIEDSLPRPEIHPTPATPSAVPSKEDPDFRKKLYDFIIQSLETQKDSLPEDKMLINTTLYLKHGANWKDAIRAYWKSR